MANQVPTSPSQVSNEDIVLAAVDSINWSDPKVQSDPERMVAVRALTIRRLLAPSSLPMTALNAVALPSEIVKVEFEERSQRYLVTFRRLGRDQDGNPFQEEIVRSDRVDSNRGDRTRNLCTGLMPGRKYMVYKETQSSPDGTKKYRHLVWATPIL